MGRGGVGCLYHLSLSLITIPSDQKKKGSGILREFLMAFTKKQYGKGRRDDPELPGEISLTSLIRNRKEKEEARSRAPGRDFIITFNKKQ